MPRRGPVEIRNLAEVREAISVCVEQERSLTECLVLGLHRTLMKDVPENPGDPIKPGEYRGAADDKRFTGFKYLEKHKPPPWKVRSALISLLEDAEDGRLGPGWGRAAGRFLYRFLRIHPFCDGNGRMARALSTLLLARDRPDVLTFEKPVEAVILEHRDDYIDVLEYCDGIYEDLRGANIPEEEKLRRAERPFSDFHVRAFLKACRENNHKPPEDLGEKGRVTVRKIDRCMDDLSLEAIKASPSWNRSTWGWPPGT